MNSPNSNPSHDISAWLAHEAFRGDPDDRQVVPTGSNAVGTRCCASAFTILELMLVVGIIGLMAAMALPHLSGFTKANTMSAATRQLLDDVGLARQRALANRSEVDMVFLPPNFFWTNLSANFQNLQLTNLLSHQYSAYALISMRTVGDQPGKSNVHYLTDWRVLPQGIYISPFQLTNSFTAPVLQPLNVTVTNTTTSLTNSWAVYSFPWRYYPFPSTYSANTNGYNNGLPYIGFAANGQLTTNGDQFILLTSGSIFYPLDPNTGLPQYGGTANLVETPPGNATNNPNLIHIDWLTARARVERNQF